MSVHIELKVEKCKKFRMWGEKRILRDSGQDSVYLEVYRASIRGFNRGTTPSDLPFRTTFSFTVSEAPGTTD